MTATMSSLILKRAAASRTSGEWREDDSDLVADGIVVDQTPRVHHPARVGTPIETGPFRSEKGAREWAPETFA